MSFYLSPSYFFIKDLNKEKNALIEGYPVYKKKAEDEDRKYYLMKLKADQSESIFDNFSLKETHFSFDKFYDSKSEAHGLTPIHFTQTYVSLADNTERVVHGYLNAKGEYEYAKVKQIPKSHTAIELTLEQESKLKINIQKHRVLLNTLLKEKEERIKNLKKQADQLEWELTDLSRTLNKKETRNNYLEVAKKFLDTVQKHNRYSELKDKDVRDKIIERMFHNIKMIRACGQLETKSEAPLAPQENSVEDSDLLPQKDSIHELYQLVSSKITEKGEAFRKITSTDLESLILKNELTEELNEQILVFYSFNASLIKKSSVKKIDSIISEINRFYANQNIPLKGYAFKGDIDQFKRFFPIIKKSLTQDFYKDLIMGLIEGKPVLEICEYLNNNDEQYRKAAESLSTDKKFAITQETKNLFPESSFPHKECSILLKLFLENNLPLFETLLRHGACPKSWGIAEEESDSLSSFTTLFYAIGALGCSKKPPYNHLDYLKLLLTHGVNPSETDSKLRQMVILKKKIDAIAVIEKAKKSRKIKSSHVDYVNNRFDPLVKIFSEKADVESVEFVLPYMSLFDIGWALGALPMKSDLRLKLILGSCYEVCTANSLFYASIVAASLADSIESIKKISSKDLFVIPIFYPEDNSTEEKIKLANKQLEIINSLSVAIVEKTAKLTLKEFEEEYLQVIKFTNFYMGFSCWHTAYTICMGAEAMLMTRYCQFPDESKHLIARYIEPLYDRLNTLASKLYQGEDVERIMYPRIMSLNSLKREPFNKDRESKTDHFKDILPLCVAAQNCKIKDLNRLLLGFPSHQLNEFNPSHKGWTPLHFACKAGDMNDDFACAEALILSGARIDLANFNGKKPLDLIKTHKEKIPELEKKVLERAAAAKKQSPGL